LNETADAEGCTWVDEHTVTTPKGFKEVYATHNALELQGMAFPEKYGGQNLPQTVELAKGELMSTANWAFTMFPGLSKGCMNTLLHHGSEELKDTYLPKLVTGEYTGTMCLTEPQCGSDLGQVATKATPNGDGSYSITGTKIFISCGEHDLTENIIHCVRVVRGVH
jgi:alkylation response protein AidB-like acyl-CoA dehydrogenase